MNKLVPLFAGFIGAFMMGICVQSQRTAAPPVDPNAMWAVDTRAIASWIGIPQDAITSVTIVNQGCEVKTTRPLTNAELSRLDSLIINVGCVRQ